MFTGPLDAVRGGTKNPADSQRTILCLKVLNCGFSSEVVAVSCPDVTSFPFI